MENIISKELLSEVFNKEVEYVESNLCYFEEYTSCMQGITFKDEPRTYWNIHELAHKCKEWARAKGYELYSAYIDINASICELFGINFIELEFNSDTEPEAILKACQWILDNKEQHNG